MLIDSSLPIILLVFKMSEPMEPSLTHRPIPDPHAADMLQLAEAKHAQLEKRNSCLVAKNTDLETEVSGQLNY
jgi:hypothetical protein